jgi:hypothetical protein
METQNKISQKLILWIFFWFLILGFGLAFAGYWEIENLKTTLSQYLQQGFNKEAIAPLETALLMAEKNYIWQLVAGSLSLTALFLWVTLRASLKATVAKSLHEKTSKPETKKPRKPQHPQITKEEKEKLERLEWAKTLQMISLLQRDGRLVDFLEEDLQSYDDAQIGAAVRTIQKSCQDSLKKYINPTAVIDQNEGEEITVEAGFDPAAIKLTGNVSGEPPFKGILQHRGWRAAKIELPTLSGTQDPGIIAPAEVEI